MRFNFAPGFLAAGCQGGPDVELSRRQSLAEKIAGGHRVALFVRRFRRGLGEEFSEVRIISKRIER